MPIVRPSGAALATASAPMLPPAPGLFSMMTVPSASLTRSASDARRDVDRAAGRVGNDQADRALGLCARAARSAGGGDRSEARVRRVCATMRQRRTSESQAPQQHSVRRRRQVAAVLVGLGGEGVGVELVLGQAALRRRSRAWPNRPRSARRRHRPGSRDRSGKSSITRLVDEAGAALPVVLGVGVRRPPARSAGSASRRHARAPVVHVQVFRPAAAPVERGRRGRCA